MAEVSIKASEDVGSKWFPAHNTVKVEITRICHLTADMSAVVSRRLGGISISSGNPQKQLITLDLEAAEWLVVALSKAIAAAQEMEVPIAEPLDASESGDGAGDETGVAA